MYKKRIFLLLLICQHFVHAQQPLNLSFETKSLDGWTRPWGWTIYGNPSVESVSMDSTHQLHGKFSLRVQANQSPCILSYRFMPFELEKQKVSIKSWLNGSDFKGKVSLVLFYYTSQGSNDGLRSDTLVIKSVNADWSNHTLQTTIKDAVSGEIEFQIIVEGSGTLWLDHLSLWINGKPKSTLEIARSFTATQKKWFRQRIIPFKSVEMDSVHSDVADLSFLKSICNGSNIIAMGESTHGTSEFFKLKHRVLAYAVKELGVRVFAIEDNMAIVECVNAFVKGGAGTARSSMWGMLGVWQNEEVKNMIQWVRDYNDKHPNDKVEFMGFDIQNFVKTTADTLFSWITPIDERFSQEIKTTLKDLLSDPNRHFVASDDQKQQWKRATDSVLELVNIWKGRIEASRQISLAVQQKLGWILQYARLINQYARNNASPALFYRDTAMAQNVAWIHEVYRPGVKMLLWAHDTHVSRGDHPIPDNNIYSGITMGAHLSKRYGPVYKSFGISSYEGAYLGFLNYQRYDKTYSCPLIASPRGTIEEVLHQFAKTLKKDLLFLNLAKGRKEAWLSEPLYVRFANHVNMEFAFPKYSVPFSFDGIFFIDQTTPAKGY